MTVLFRVASLVLVAFALSSSSLAQEPNSQIGRYTIVFSPIVRADTFLLDTVTGNVWQMIQYSQLNGEPTAWSMVTRIDNSVDHENFVKAYGLKPKPSGQRQKAP